MYVDKGTTILSSLHIVPGDFNCLGYFPNRIISKWSLGLYFVVSITPFKSLSQAEEDGYLPTNLTRCT